MTAAGNESHVLQLIQRSRDRLARGADHLREDRVAHGKVDVNTVTGYVTVVPGKLEELAPHPVDMAGEGEIAHCFLLLRERDRELFEQYPRCSGHGKKTIERIPGNDDQVRRPEAEQHLLRRGRHHELPRARLAGDYRARPAGARADDDEASLEFRKYGTPASRSIVGQAATMADTRSTSAGRRSTRRPLSPVLITHRCRGRPRSYGSRERHF